MRNKLFKLRDDFWDSYDQGVHTPTLKKIGLNKMGFNRWEETDFSISLTGSSIFLFLEICSKYEDDTECGVYLTQEDIILCKTCYMEPLVDSE